ncbi:MAG: hypothetical protein LBP22_02390 [Deltaproteobacteria bacterium]|nr:hypothetical protein [Deltaproteobacteria bacterium]
MGLGRFLKGDGSAPGLGGDLRNTAGDSARERIGSAGPGRRSGFPQSGGRPAVPGQASGWGRSGSRPGSGAKAPGPSAKGKIELCRSGSGAGQTSSQGEEPL